MKNSRIEYFLNAVFYCMWRWENRSNQRIKKLVDWMLYPLAKLTASKKESFKNHRAMVVERDKADTLTKKFIMKTTIFRFGYMYSGYSILVGFLIAAILIRFPDMADIKRLLVSFVSCIVAVVVGYIPVLNNVYSNNRYLEYFKMFEKEDNDWHRRWRRRTIWFCVLSVAATVLGMFILCKSWVL